VRQIEPAPLAFRRTLIGYSYLLLLLLLLLLTASVHFGRVRYAVLASSVYRRMRTAQAARVGSNMPLIYPFLGSTPER